MNAAIFFQHLFIDCRLVRSMTSDDDRKIWKFSYTSSTAVPYHSLMKTLKMQYAISSSCSPVHHSNFLPSTRHLDPCCCSYVHWLTHFHLHFTHFILNFMLQFNFYHLIQASRSFWEMKNGQDENVFVSKRMITTTSSAIEWTFSAHLSTPFTRYSIQSHWMKFSLQHGGINFIFLFNATCLDSWSFYSSFYA